MQDNGILKLHRQASQKLQYKSKETPQVIGLFSPNLVTNQFHAIAFSMGQLVSN